MYKSNKRHLQPMLISNVRELPEKNRQRLEDSWAGVFYRETFCRLKEDIFAVLYNDEPSRPNTPVNILVGLDTIKDGFGWSDQELYDHFLFDLQVRYALGYHNLNEGEFDIRTLYNFRRRLSQYNQEHGVNLLVQAFEGITDQQISDLKVETSVQRMDSTQIASNIMDMSRLQLLVEAIQRLYRILSEADQATYAAEFAPYLKSSSGQYTYRIKGKEETHATIQKVGESMDRLVKGLADRYGSEPVFQVFQRFFKDNFHLVVEQIQAKKGEEISAGCLQSCDDLEATFRRKKEQEYKGYVANLTETCVPNNPCQLITKVQVSPNNVEDVDLMVAALPDLKQRTDLEVLHADGAYGSPEGDKALQKHQVELIQTAIKGRHPDQGRFGLASYIILMDRQGMPTQMTCPKEQIALIHLGRKKGAWVADFDPQVCETCPFHTSDQCRAKPGKRDLLYHLDFNSHEVQVAVRRQAMDRNKRSGKNLRAAVEATMRVIKLPFPAGKLPVRGLFRVTCTVIGSALMCNVRSILRCQVAQRKADKPQNATPQNQECAGEQPTPSFLAAFSARLLSPFRTLTFRLSCFSC